jgi:hypothetical protein
MGARKVHFTIKTINFSEGFRRLGLWTLLLALAFAKSGKVLG